MRRQPPAVPRAKLEDFSVHDHGTKAPDDAQQWRSVPSGTSCKDGFICTAKGLSQWDLRAGFSRLSQYVQGRSGFGEELRMRRWKDRGSNDWRSKTDNHGRLFVFLHEAERVLRRRIFPHRCERLAMQRRGAVLAQGGQMPGRAVAFVRG